MGPVKAKYDGLATFPHAMQRRIRCRSKESALKAKVKGTCRNADGCNTHRSRCRYSHQSYDGYINVSGMMAQFGS